MTLCYDNRWRCGLQRNMRCVQNGTLLFFMQAPNSLSIPVPRSQRPPSSKLPPRASYKRALRLRRSPMLLLMKDVGNHMAVLVNLARYCARVSNLSISHLASVIILVPHLRQTGFPGREAFLVSRTQTKKLHSTRNMEHRIYGP